MSEFVQRAREKVTDLKRQLEPLRDRWKRDPRVLRLKVLLEQAERIARNRDHNEIIRLQNALKDAEKEHDRAIDAAKHADAAGIDFNRKVTLTQVDRIERPRSEGGVDWSNTRMVLARYGDKELWWMRSGKHWGDLLRGYVSHGGDLILFDHDDKRMRAQGDYGRCGKRLEGLQDLGGRLSKARIMEHAGKINAFFGVPDVAENCHIKKTLIVSDVLPEAAEGGVQAVDVASGPGSTGPLVPPVDG